MLTKPLAGFAPVTLPTTEVAVSARIGTTCTSLSARRKVSTGMALAGRKTDYHDFVIITIDRESTE